MAKEVAGLIKLQIKGGGKHCNQGFQAEKSNEENQ